MKKYQRITVDMNDRGSDEIYSLHVNEKLEKFLEKNKVSNYTLLNAETIYSDKMDVRLCMVLHIMYDE
ncbi:MAG: hypothetical protein INR69_01775 [Mucilaginibacter polytrichastri]|nr:hypothetical protein [Mucilaginibacter polytrichastri]